MTVVKCHSSVTYCNLVGMEDAFNESFTKRCCSVLKDFGRCLTNFFVLQTSNVTLKLLICPANELVAITPSTSNFSPIENRIELHQFQKSSIYVDDIFVAPFAHKSSI